MKNTTTDLNNHLFEQLERLNNEELKGDALVEEIERAKAINAIGGTIINNANIALKAAEFKAEYMVNKDTTLPAFLEERNGVHRRTS